MCPKPEETDPYNLVDLVARGFQSWWKSMILQATLWVQPYIREGDF